MLIRNCFIVILGAATFGCGSTLPARSAVVEATTTESSIPTESSSAPVAQPFDLYTHCGVNGALINDVWWEVSPALNDGNSNPPNGWGNPSQPGNLNFVDEQTAIFTGESSTGQELMVTLHRTPRTDYPSICR